MRHLDGKLVSRPITPLKLLLLKSSILFLKSKTNGNLVERNFTWNLSNNLTLLVTSFLKYFLLLTLVIPYSPHPWLFLLKVSFALPEDQMFILLRGLSSSWIMSFSHGKSHLTFPCWWLLIEQKTLFLSFRFKKPNCLQDMCIFLSYFKCDIAQSEVKIFINPKIYSSSSVL